MTLDVLDEKCDCMFFSECHGPRDILPCHPHVTYCNLVYILDQKLLYDYKLRLECKGGLSQP